jgi:hypothetical protein
LNTVFTGTKNRGTIFGIKDTVTKFAAVAKVLDVTAAHGVFWLFQLKNRLKHYKERDKLIRFVSSPVLSVGKKRALLHD